ITGLWPMEIYQSPCQCHENQPMCYPSSNESESCYCAHPESAHGMSMPYCAPKIHWHKSKCSECTWHGECQKSYSLEATHNCFCHNHKCLAIQKSIIQDNGQKPLIRVRRQVKKLYEKIYNRYDGLLAVYSMCKCQDDHCTALTDNMNGSVCLCFFNRKNGQIWPCYPPELWAERKCNKCSPLGDCIYDDIPGKLPCVCASIIKMCVRIEERSSTEIQPFENDNGTSTELIDDIFQKEKFKLADVIPKMWEITTTTTPIPEDVQERQMAYGFKGVSDPVAIRAKATENLVFAVSGLKDEEKRTLSYSKKEMITKCSFNGRQCSVERDFSVYIDPSFGNCFTFNYNISETMTTERAG
uniref:Uncharacterized protein n=1 Tax=Panagrolaimus sp. JU765 TaxID=591449 RepID=A0AC34Q978_9BILA